MADLQGTHLIDVDGDVVTKRYVDGKEGAAEREWRALTLLARYAPGLAPEPLEFDGHVRMSRIDGVPMRTLPEPALHAAEMAAAVGRLHGAVPQEVLAAVPIRAWYADRLVTQVRTWCETWQPRDDLADRAVKEGRRWLESWRPGGEGVTPVFGSGDGNLTNYLWDGERVRLVDFEDAGRSDLAFELADRFEHVAMWVDGDVDLSPYVRLTPAEALRLRDCRRLQALTWLFLLSHDDGTRNPPGTFHRQAERVLGRL